MTENQIKRWKAIDRKREIQVARYAPRFQKAVAGMVRPFLTALESVESVGSIALIAELPQNPAPMMMALEHCALNVGVEQCNDTLNQFVKPKADTIPNVEMDVDPVAGTGDASFFARQMDTYVSTWGAAKVVNISDANRRIIARVVQLAISQGWDIEKTQRVMRGWFLNEMSRMRALRIARTEVLSASSYANYVTGGHIQNKYGIPLLKEWIPTPYGNFRPHHLAMASKRPIPLDQDFRVGGTWMQSPHDPKAPAGEVINCRCSMAYKRQTVQQVAPGTPARVPEPTATGSGDFVPFEFFTARNKTEAKKYLAETWEKYTGQRVRKVTTSGELSLKDLNARNRQLTKLMNEYKRADEWETSLTPVNIEMVSRGRVLGVVGGHPMRGGKVLMGRANFGHINATPRGSLEWGERMKAAPKYRHDFSEMSMIPQDVNHLATLTHEFAHTLTFSEMEAAGGRIAEFWNDLRKIRKAYNIELKADLTAKNFEKAREYFVGEYGNSLLDEFLAENFAEYKLNPTPGKYALRVGELVDKYFKR